LSYHWHQRHALERPIGERYSRRGGNANIYDCYPHDATDRSDFVFANDSRSFNQSGDSEFFPESNREMDIVTKIIVALVALATVVTWAWLRRRRNAPWASITPLEKRSRDSDLQPRPPTNEGSGPATSPLAVVPLAFETAEPIIGRVNALEGRSPHAQASQLEAPALAVYEEPVLPPLNSADSSRPATNETTAHQHEAVDREPAQRQSSSSVLLISNLSNDNKVLARDDRKRLFSLGNRLWHSDSSFKVVPAKYSILHARAIPSKGGNTEFADMRAAYDALDAETRAEIADLICEHSQIFSRQQLGFFDFTEEERARFKPVRQRLVRTHPSTGRKSLYLASHAGSIVGWPVPEARCFLRDLIEHATQPRFVYRHSWRVGDLVIWDNLATMHRGRPFDDAKHRRELRRVTTLDVVNSGSGP